jgi:hypothetical protein
LSFSANCKADAESTPLIAAVNRCATQNQRVTSSFSATCQDRLATAHEILGLWIFRSLDQFWGGLAGGFVAGFLAPKASLEFFPHPGDFSQLCG